MKKMITLFLIIISLCFLRNIDVYADTTYTFTYSAVNKAIILSTNDTDGITKLWIDCGNNLLVDPLYSGAANIQTIYKTIDVSSWSDNTYTCTAYKNIKNSSKSETIGTISFKKGDTVPVEGKVCKKHNSEDEDSVREKNCLDDGCVFVPGQQGGYCYSSLTEVSTNDGSSTNSSGSSEEEGTNYSDIEANCSGVFSGFQDDLNTIFKYFQIIAPILVLAFSTFEYVSVVLNNNPDSLKKANSRLIKRLILMVVLYFLPIITNLLLSFIEDGTYNTCIDTTASVEVFR
jgi:hypothetical protein